MEGCSLTVSCGTRATHDGLGANSIYDGLAMIALHET
ncbi:hypothetical protein X742_27055 [Mesorhizobium sp. LNHC232B00]|nr:hypothetical protein X742_27055 [Mesorhizobium sp. LNHC232B00]